jgi:predicted site-specific integrase-resolvase
MEQKESLTISQVATLLNVCIKTLRRWHKEGKLLPDFLTFGGHRRYFLENVYAAFGLTLQKPMEPRINISYARVSSSDQKEDLKRQEDRLKSFTKQHKIKATLISDLGSGINYKKRGLQELLRLIMNKRVDTLYIVHRDRLLRFGYDLVAQVAKFCGTKIVILESAKDDETFEERLSKDVIEIITVFSAKLYGKRSHKNKKSVDV